MVTETRELAIEYVACCESPAYFLSHYAQISDPQTGVFPFALWNFQSDLLNTFETEQRVIVLKARQLGVSWLVAGYALWTALFHEGATVLMLSKRLDEAVSLMDKAEFVYDRLPYWLQPSIAKHNETTLQFTRRGSKILALPSTEDAGRSETASLVIVDEAAFHPHAEANYAAYKPTVDAGGKLLLVSTANGRGNFFHNVWTGAPLNGFESVFLPWTLRPGRDDDWFSQQQREYAATPHVLAQEYPANAVEAFISSGNCLFDVEAIQQMLAYCRPPISISLNGMLKIWERPRVGRRYVAGADVAEGIDVGNDRLDYSGVAIYDWQTCQHVADLHGQWDPETFAGLADTLCREYNDAFLGVERNNHGHAVLLKLRQLEYPSLYYHTELDREITTGKQSTRRTAGWPTTRQTKPVLENTLGSLIASGGINSYDQAFWDECLSYVRHGDGRTGAQQGTHDDRVIAHMIALQMRDHLPPSGGNSIVVGSFRIGDRER